MANETIITIVGNLTSDPELKFTKTGAAVVRFSVAVTPRKFDKQSGGWIDGDTSFYRCEQWNQYAENINATLVKGCRVLVMGELNVRRYETDNGRGVSVELRNCEVGPVLRYVTASLAKYDSNMSQDGTRSAIHGQTQSTPTQTAPNESKPVQGAITDPWDDTPAPF